MAPYYGILARQIWLQWRRGPFRSLKTWNWILPKWFLSDWVGFNKEVLRYVSSVFGWWYAKTSLWFYLFTDLASAKRSSDILSSARKNFATWRGSRFWSSWFVCRRISDISSSSFLNTRCWKMQWGFLNIGVIVGPGLLLPEKVEGGGDFYLTAVVEHVQREEEEVENTEKTKR